MRAISVYGMVIGLAATSGQLIGGQLIRGDVAGLGWRLIFLNNLPLGLAGLLAASRPRSRWASRSGVAVTGVLFFGGISHG